LHWTAWPHNPVLDPWAGDTPPVRGGKADQIHDTVAWKESGYYLALYQYQHDGASLDLHLAVSRDGDKFTFIDPEVPLLPAGRAGEWDSDQVNPSPPLEDGPQIRMYYGAIHYAGGVESSQAASEAGVGLATLRRDGYTDLDLGSDRAEGSVTTIPVRPAGATRLLVNADCAGGRIEAELVDPATHRPWPGFARLDCLPLEGDGEAMPIRWRRGGGLGDLRSNFQIRLFVDRRGAHSPRIYSLLFQGSEP